MKKNLGNMDRVLRVIIALAIVALYFAGAISGPVAIGLLVAGGIFVLTSIVGVCPLYLPFGIDTGSRM